MFDFLGRGKPGRRGKGRGPVTIGFEQLEGRELLSAGLSLTIIPSGQPPLASMPRPIVGSLDPESDGPRIIPVAMPVRVKVRVEPTRRRGPIWPLGGRFRMGDGPWRMNDD
jgi:hypothetical protein